ncbi:unnamed protein product [Adineta steineri]|uniref:Kinesin light chain n=1 Tax=Adineta steineri TaxID=433720 RepID=A0A815CUI8_9BILA|nr:unnamed protein product [Adineta steineri]CAF1551172.1 unnamed protein product [Adineta steineri]
MSELKKQIADDIDHKNSTSAAHPSEHTHIIQNFRVIWLDSNIDTINNSDSINTLMKLRQVVNTVETFTDVNKCLNSINDIDDEKIFMILSGRFGQTIISDVHSIFSLHSIYIFCSNKTQHEQWTQQWCKIKGVFTDITPICEVLKQAAHECAHNSVSLGFISLNDTVIDRSLDHLDKSYMYTQILKEILLTIPFKSEHMKEFFTYCRKKLLLNNNIELKNVDKIEHEYHDRKPIWWYTYQCFLYSTLNKALRTMEVDLIIKLGFFIQDLHKHIVQLHAEQYGGQNNSDVFTVYRGQSLSETDFNQLISTQGGLLSFNNFLSTSKNRNVSLAFARRTINSSNKIGVLFIMKIDPMIRSTPFANIINTSAFKKEDEILFSMHSVFRIGEAKQIDGPDSRLWKVKLTLTCDTDPQLHRLTQHIRTETFSSSIGWHRLGQLLIKLDQFDKAQQVFEIILNQSNDQGEKGNIYHMLGIIKNNQGKYFEAIEVYEKSNEINHEIQWQTYSYLASFYNNIGLVFDNMGEYSAALSSHEKAVEIYCNSFPSNHLDVAYSHNNIGRIYNKMGEYSKALSSHEKALEIKKKNLPPDHPSLASSFNNIGLVYSNIGEYSKALSSHEKALEIKLKILPSDHPSLASSYNNIGLIYDKLGEYSAALSSHEKALEIKQKTLRSKHPHLATTCSNIGGVYFKMYEYSKALLYYEMAHEIYYNSLPSYHPGLATSYNNIGWVYRSMGEYPKALSYFESALEIRRHSLPANHPDIHDVQNSTDIVYDFIIQSLANEVINR